MSLFLKNIDLENKKVLIMGLGTKGGGIGAVKFFSKMGSNITVTDLKNKDELQESLKKLNGYNLTYKLGTHDMNDFLDSEIIIKNPGIKRSNVFLKEAINRNIIVESPIGIFSEFIERPYIGITGTKGKTFTTTLINHILNKCGTKSVAAGNNCISPLDYLGEQDTTFVMELSSWQLSELRLHKKSPHISCWLNFFPDHLNYYDNMDDYFNDKFAITQFQGKDDFLIIPYNDDILKNIKTNAEKIYFSDNDKADFDKGSFVKNNKVVFKDKNNFSEIINIDELPAALKAKHQLKLLLAAISTISCYKVPLENIKKYLINFTGISHRFEFVKEINNIKYINDSAATTPRSTLCALDNFDNEKLALIMGGGHHKNLDFSELYDRIIFNNIKIFIFENDITSDKVKKDLTLRNYDNFVINNNMKEAVLKSSDYIKNKNPGVVLLSPACSGAPFYQDLFVRGDLFKKSVDKFCI